MLQRNFLLATSLVAVFFLTACAGPFSIVDKNSLALSQQCLNEQQTLHEQLITLHEQQQQTLALMAETLTKPLQVNAPVVRLSQIQSACHQTPLIASNVESREMNDTSKNKLIIGEIEDIWLPELNLILTSRIDTGATTASIDARNIQSFERDGTQWVRYSIINPQTDKAVQFESKIVRNVRVVQSNSEQAENRPVIELQVVIGHISQQAEFTLTDRNHLNYQVLIGRNVLRDVMIVDVSQSHLVPIKTQQKP